MKSPILRLSAAASTSERVGCARDATRDHTIAAYRNCFDVTERPMPSSHLILGGGIYGASIGYYLAQRGAPSIILESQPEAALTASGKAAGFLGGSWGDGRVTERLHRTSFEIHEQLAKDLGIKSYRKMSAFRVGDGGSSNNDDTPQWLDGDGVEASLIDGDAAQVEPYELTQALLREAQATGHCTLRTGAEVVGLDCDEDKNVCGVRLAGGEAVECDATLTIALGPWSCMVEEWLDYPMPIEGTWSTSILYHSADGDGLATSALFCEEDQRGCHLEVFPRPTGEVYVAGCGGSRLISAEALRAGAVPPSATNDPDASRVTAASSSLGELSSLWKGKAPEVTRACIRPVAPDGLPIIGQLPSHSNVYVATGANVWGILWAPVCGKAMSELLLDGEASTVNLKPFSPRRFDTLTHRTLLKQRGRRTADGSWHGEQY